MIITAGTVRSDVLGLPRSSNTRLGDIRPSGARFWPACTMTPPPWSRPPNEQAELLALDGDTFRAAPHVGRFGWVQVRLDRVSCSLLTELIATAWRNVASKRLVQSHVQAGSDRS